MLKKNINFIGNIKKYIIASVAIILVGIIATLVFGPVLDIQFKGGSKLSYSYTGEIKYADAEKALKDVLKKDYTVSGSTDISGNAKKLVISMGKNVKSETVDAAEKALATAFPKNNIESSEVVSVEASVGKRFFFKALVAVLLAWLLVILYVGFRFRKIGGVSAGITSLMALVHDILIAFFVCVIFRLPIDANFIAVVLTLLGYSLNDTIIIYDRIRENRRMYGNKLSLGELVNKSNNETLSRTILTALSTLLAVVVVIIVSEIKGLTSLRSFSIPLAAGILSGSYSSICLAPCVWAKWKEKKNEKLASTRSNRNNKGKKK